MRTILAAIGLSAILFSTGAQAYFAGQLRQPCDRMPPASAQQPIGKYVHVVVKVVAPNKINAACQIRPDAMEYGCTFLPTSGNNIWRVYLNAAMNAKERACTIVYEQAHMPPNNWLDPVVESWGKN